MMECLSKSRCCSFPPHTLCTIVWQSKKSPDTDHELCVQMNFWLISFFPSFQTWSTKHRRRMTSGSVIIMRFHPIWSQCGGSLNWKDSGTGHRLKPSHPLIRRKSEQNDRITMGFPQGESENSTYDPYDSWQVTKPCVCYLISWVWLFVTPWTVAHQASLPMGFSGQEYWSGLPCPPPGDFPNPGIEPGSPTLQADSLPSEY